MKNKIEIIAEIAQGFRDNGKLTKVSRLLHLPHKLSTKYSIVLMNN